LQRMGYPHSPSVLIVPKDKVKATIADALDLTAFIDDRMEVGRHIRCQFFLVNRPWNQAETLRRRQKRVSGLEGALDILEVI
jgi:hypothetical protein